MSGTCPTVRIRHGDSFATINRDDFDAARHELWTDAPGTPSGTPQDPSAAAQEPGTPSDPALPPAPATDGEGQPRRRIRPRPTA